MPYGYLERRLSLLGGYCQTPPKRGYVPYRCPERRFSLLGGKRLLKGKCFIDGKRLLRGERVWEWR